MSTKERATPSKEVTPVIEQGDYTTQRAEVLAMLESGKRITPKDALREVGSFRLASVIHELRKRGHVIESRTITVPSKRCRMSRVSEYWMVSDHAQRES